MKSRQFIFFFTDSQTISKLAAGTDSPHYKQLQFKARGFIQALNHHKFRLYMLKCRFLVIRSENFTFSPPEGSILSVGMLLLFFNFFFSPSSCPHKDFPVFRQTL